MQFDEKLNLIKDFMQDNINSKNIDKKLELIRSIMQFEGDMTLQGTTYNCNKQGDVQFSGYKDINGELQPIYIALNKYQVEELNNCNTVLEIYNCYKQMEYF